MRQGRLSAISPEERAPRPRRFARLVFAPAQRNGLRDLRQSLERTEVDVAVFAAAVAAGLEGDRYLPDLELVQDVLRCRVGDQAELTVRAFRAGQKHDVPVLLAALKAGLEEDLLQDGVVTPILKTAARPEDWDQAVVRTPDVKRCTTWTQILDDLMNGRSLLFAAQLPWVLTFDLSKPKQRSIDRPNEEVSLRGPQESFNEVLETQIGQLRRRFPEPDLVVERLTLGTNRIPVAVVHLKGLTNPALVDAVRKRLARLSLGHIVAGAQIGGAIRDEPRSFFPTVRTTERVDLVSWFLAEGKVAILVDGDPFALVVPAVLNDFFRTAMDFSAVWYDSTFVRMIRLLGWFIGIYLPALYIALTYTDLNVLAPEMLTSIEGGRAGLPITPLAEVLIMIFVVEVLRETSVRLPQPIGATIGTIGAIVVGTSVVKAGIVSPQIIVVITLTALSFYTAPDYQVIGSWRVMGFVMLAAAAILGIYGIALASAAMVTLLIEMKSFGSPYFAPFAPARLSDWTRTIVRVPWTMITDRPTFARPLDHGWPGRPALRPVPLMGGKRQRG